MIEELYAKLGCGVVSNKFILVIFLDGRFNFLDFLLFNILAIVLFFGSVFFMEIIIEKTDFILFFGWSGWLFGFSSA